VNTTLQNVGNPWDLIAVRSFSKPERDSIVAAFQERRFAAIAALASKMDRARTTAHRGTKAKSHTAEETARESNSVFEKRQHR